MGNYPSMGTKGGTVVGALELNICYRTPCCKCRGPWDSKCCEVFCPCCPGMHSPTGAEWEAAKEGFTPFLEEAATTAFKVGGCCMNVFNVKKELDKDWTNRANTYLATHGLTLEVCAYYTSDGKSTHPHLVLQFTKAQLANAE